MDIKIIASSSKGNAIVLSDGKTKVMLDAGLTFKKLQNCLFERDMSFTEINAVLVTHEHADHCVAVPELLRRGMDVYMSAGTKSKTGNFNLATVVKGGKQFQVGSLLVMPFDVVHDANEPLGFLIESLHTNKKAVYIVDTCEIPYTFSGITHWIIECNHSQDILRNSNVPDFLKKRIINSHLSFENLEAFLKEEDMTGCESIHLIHLSDSNSHEKDFVDGIQRATGVPVYTDTMSKLKIS